jgi:hypothetical protein
MNIFKCLYTSYLWLSLYRFIINRIFSAFFISAAALLPRTMRFIQRSRLVAVSCGTGVRFRWRRTSAGVDIVVHHLHQLIRDVFDDTLDSSSSSSDSGVVATGGWRLRQYERQAKTAADDDVSCLEIRKLESEHEGNCPVCQCEWELGDEVRVLPCGHQFHTHCIEASVKLPSLQEGRARGVGGCGG